jgi:hypothetical protein
MLEKSEWEKSSFKKWISRQGYIEKCKENGKKKYDPHLIGWAEIEIGFDDIDEFGQSFIVDGPDDKGIDLIAHNDDWSKIYIAQSYYSDAFKKDPPEIKATNMNQGIQWILKEKLDAGNVNPSFRAASEEVRDKFSEDSSPISEVNIIYIHNCHESKKIKDELAVVASTAEIIIKDKFQQTNVRVNSKEIGIETLNIIFSDYGVDMKVRDKIDFNLDFSGIEVEEGDWRAYVTAIKTKELKVLWKKYNKRLLSGNIRDYLGSNRHKGNINAGIQKTLDDSPENFAVYNNGITVLVNNFQCNNNILTVEGMNIVNGGQTTGSIGNSQESEGHVIVRFIQVKNKDSDKFITDNIIKYNNIQNSVIPEDFRNSDAIQVSLKKEFEEIYKGKVVYSGLRRGENKLSAADKRKTISGKEAAQVLASFRGYPNIAYNKTKEIWENNNTYLKCFDGVTPQNLLFIDGLYKAIIKYSKNLSGKTDEDGNSVRTEAEEKQHTYFTQRGSKWIFMYAIRSFLDSILGRKIDEQKYYTMHFNESSCETIEESKDLWYPIVESLSYAVGSLQKATGSNMSNTNIESSLQDFKLQAGGILMGMRNSNPFSSFLEIYEE